MLTLNTRRERTLELAAIVAAGVASLVISFAVSAAAVPRAYYSAVSAVIPLLLIALFTAFGRDRADVLGLSREVDRVRQFSEPSAEGLARFRTSLYQRAIQVRNRFIRATVVAAIGETAALVGIASHSTTLLLAVTILTMLGLVIVVVAAEIVDLGEVPHPDDPD
jgi:hypothetical protein